MKFKISERVSVNKRQAPDNNRLSKFANAVIKFSQIRGKMLALYYLNPFVNWKVN